MFSVLSLCNMCDIFLIGRNPITFAHADDFDEAFAKLGDGAQLDVTLDDSAEYVFSAWHFMKFPECWLLVIFRITF